MKLIQEIVDMGYRVIINKSEEGYYIQISIQYSEDEIYETSTLCYPTVAEAVQATYKYIKNHSRSVI